MADKTEKLDLKPFSKVTDSVKRTPVAPAEYYDWKKDKSKDNMGRLLKVVAPVVDKALTSYAGPSATTLRTRATLMAADNVVSCDDKKGMTLNSYLMQSLRSLNRERANRENVVHMPENIILTRNKLSLAERNFASEKGRDPTVVELADITGVPKRAIERARLYRPYAPSSMTMSEKGDSLFHKGNDYDRVWAEYVYHDLDDKDRKIYEWTTGYMGTPTRPKQDIARKLKISPAAVSLRINKIVAKLEEGAQYAGDRT